MSGTHLSPKRWRYSAAELWADGAIHVIGNSLALVASIALFAVLVNHATSVELVVVAIYVASLLVSLGLSAAYNIWPVSPTKWFLRRFDYSAIYFLIAGTYTPFMFKSGTIWLLAVVWAIAISGVLLRLLMPDRFNRLSVLVYLGLGWSGLVAYDKIFGSLSSPVLWLIVIGGVVYSVGVVFHLWERLKFQNAIWHGFVLVAACTHFVAVWQCFVV